MRACNWLSIEYLITYFLGEPVSMIDENLSVVVASGKTKKPTNLSTKTEINVDDIHVSFVSLALSIQAPAIS